MSKPWKKLNSCLERNSNLLSSWSSILQILVFPSILLTIILGYFQLKDYFIKPDLHLFFSSSKSLTYTVSNESHATAEKPSYGFGIFDLDKKPIDTVHVPWKETSYLRPDSLQGPNELMGKYGVAGHRYFGFASISCKNCIKERWYWIYVVHGSEKDAWYYELSDDDPKLWNPIALMNNPDLYMQQNFPMQKRIPIK
jgi:hypothetical protein